MVDADLLALDLPTLAALAGGAANEHLLHRIREGGFEGVRISHGYVIQLLIDDDPTVGDIAERLGVTQQAASKSVAELERIGIVQRQSDAADNRVRRVALTERGRALVAAGRRERRTLEKRVQVRVGGSDLDAAKRALVALLMATDGSAAVMGRRVRPPSD